MRTAVSRSHSVLRLLRRALLGITLAGGAAHTVAALAAPPPLTARDDAYRLDEDVAWIVAAPGLLVNDLVTNIPAPAVVLFEAPLYGMVELTGAGGFRYQPPTNFFGLDEFRYRLISGSRTSAPARVTLTVQAVPDRPRLGSVTAGTDEDHSVVLHFPWSDADGDLARWVDATPALHGDVRLLLSEANQVQVEYVPLPDYHGPDDFELRLTDGVFEVTANAQLTVASVPDLPALRPDRYAAPWGLPLAVSLSEGVLANDSPGDATNLVATLATPPAHGVVALRASGAFTYTAEPGFLGVDRFTYRGLAGTTNSTATVELGVGDTRWEPRLGTPLTAPVLALLTSPGRTYVGLEVPTGGTGSDRPCGLYYLEGTIWMPAGHAPPFGPGGPVHALASLGGHVIAAGAFAEADGRPARNIARYDGYQWSALAEGLNDRVLALAVSGTNVYAGGDFLVAGGRRANRVAKWNGRHWEPLGSGVNGRVYALAVAPDGRLHAGGAFTEAGGVAVRHLASWNGSSWTDTTGGCDGVVRVLMAGGPYLWAGGAFKECGGTRTGPVGRWNSTNWEAFATGPALDEVTALQFMGTALLAGGRSPQLDPTKTTVYSWDGLGWTDQPPLTAASTPTVNALARDPFGTGFLVGGNFEAAGATLTGPLARWDDGRWTGLHSGIQTGSAVLATAVTDTTLYVGGEFQVVAGQRLAHVARRVGNTWEPLGTPETNGVDGRVLALAARGDEVFVGGEFTRTAGLPRRYLGRWTPAGWSSLGAGVDGPVHALAWDRDGSLCVGGRFDFAGNRPLRGLARWNGSAWSAVGEALDGHVDALLVHGGELYAAGTFAHAGSTPAFRIARWDGVRWSALGGTADAPRFNGPILALSAHGRYVFAGGDFDRVDGRPSHRVARWDGAAWQPLGGTFDWPGHSTSVQSLLALGDQLFVGGDFTAIDDTAASGIAVWNGSTWRGLGSGLGNASGDVAARTLAFNGATLTVGGSFRTAGRWFSDRLAEWLVSERPPTVTLTTPVDLARVPAGAPAELQAEATDGSAPVVRVEFYVDRTLVGTSTVPPHRTSWDRPLVGDYRLYARAIDAAGHAAETPPTRLTVISPPGNQAPSVRLVAPPTGTVATLGRPFDWAAEATDPDGTVLDVALLENGNEVARFAGPPWQLAWIPTLTGEAVLTARARDAFGMTGTSDPVLVRVQRPPEVLVVSPREGDTFSLPDPVLLEADARDAEGPITRVDFHLDGAFFASATEFSSPIARYRWENPAPGSHTVTAVAVDDSGASATSAPVRFRVLAANQLPSIVLTAPADPTIVGLPAAVPLVAEASDPDGSITEVRFYASGRRFLTVTRPPYVAVLRNLIPGSHELRVEAIDDRGGLARSAVVTLVATNDPARLPRFELVELGTLGGDSSTAFAINDSGDVVGQAMRPDRRDRGFLFHAGRPTEVPSPYGTNGGPAQATDLNETGLIVGTADSLTGVTRGFVLVGTNVVTLPTLGGTRSFATRVNADGRIAGAAEDASGTIQPAWFQGTNVHRITGDGRGGAAYGINAAGVIVGRTEDFDGRYRPFLYDPVAGYRPLPGVDAPAEPRDINDAGDVTGMFEGPLGFVAGLWSRGGLVELGTLGGSASQGLALNRDAQVVGFAHDAEGQSRAFLWHGGQMLDLNGLMPPHPRWRLTAAQDINNRGDIVGEGLWTDDQGNPQRRAFLLRLAEDSPVRPSDNVPVRVRAGTLVARVTVPRGQSTRVERSPDLVRWSVIATNHDRSGLVEFTAPLPPDLPTLFYRFVPSDPE